MSVNTRRSECSWVLSAVCILQNTKINLVIVRKFSLRLRYTLPSDFYYLKWCARCNRQGERDRERRKLLFSAIIHLIVLFFARAYGTCNPVIKANCMFFMGFSSKWNAIFHPEIQTNFSRICVLNESNLIRLLLESLSLRVRSMSAFHELQNWNKLWMHTAEHCTRRHAPTYRCIPCTGYALLLRINADTTFSYAHEAKDKEIIHTTERGASNGEALIMEQNVQVHRSYHPRWNLWKKTCVGMILSNEWFHLQSKIVSVCYRIKTKT